MKVCIFCFLPKILQAWSLLQARYSDPGKDWDKAWDPSLVRYLILDNSTKSKCGRIVFQGFLGKYSYDTGKKYI